jgi:hypothetical protein
MTSRRTKVAWSHWRDVDTHVLLDRDERIVGFVRRGTFLDMIDHYFARAYVGTHENGFNVKTLAEGKALVDDMVQREPWQ